MRISTEIGSLSKHVGEEKAVELVAKAGFDAWDFSMFKMVNYDWDRNILLPTDHPLNGSNYVSFAKKLRKIGEDNGIHCNQSHAPYPTYNKDIRSYLKRAIECTAIAGAGVCVIHPDNYLGAKENAEMYLELLPFAKEMGVKIATENMWIWDSEKNCATKAACSHHDDFLAHIKAVNDPNLVACLDIGHAEMRGLNTSCPEMIETLGESLQALHIHDNDKWRDSHGLPRTMSIDFDRILRSLKKIDYKGYFTLEADAYLSNFTAENVFDGVCNMAKCARALADEFENL